MEVRLVGALIVFAAMAAWEAAVPFRRPSIARKIRWPNNLGVILLDIAVVRLAVPTSLIAAAVAIESSGWGIFNLFSLPSWVAIIAALILLDLAIYLQHVIFHAIPALWRLHRMHHTDQDFDVTTGLRFHPFEILLSMAYKVAVIAVLGAPPVAVLIFEVVLNASSLFNHGNVSLPSSLDRVLRWIVVTPNMHRIHHSVRPNETNSNFGFNLPWWDRLLGTYRAQAATDEGTMKIGINQFRSTHDQRLDRMLIQPFRGAATSYPINRAAGAQNPSPESDATRADS
jgi:sterol desaturase/sphingolipid hydroxylase (fatty acid hydroxylase superfamily)